MEHEVVIRLISGPPLSWLRATVEETDRYVKIHDPERPVRPEMRIPWASILTIEVGPAR